MREVYMNEYIDRLIEAIKRLPVKCESFDDADRWVGVVLGLSKLKEEVKEDA